MKLDSVRGLKQSLPAHLHKTFAVRAAAGRTATWPSPVQRRSSA